MPFPCPFCRETVTGTPSRCPHCDEPLDAGGGGAAVAPALVERIADLREAKTRAGRALLYGIVAFAPICVFPWILGIAAIVLGARSIAATSRHTTPADGRAIAGIICGALALLGWTSIMVLWMLIGEMR